MSASEDFSKVRAEFRREIRNDDRQRRTSDWRVLANAVVFVVVVALVTTIAVTSPS